MGDLYNKYIIKKSDGSDVDPNAMYFVLRLDSDAHARTALMAYAASVLESDSKFAYELINWVLQIRSAQPPLKPTRLLRRLPSTRYLL